MHVHACLLALHTGKPVKMTYSREESVFGHVHRHPARISYEHGACRTVLLVSPRPIPHLAGVPSPPSIAPRLMLPSSTSSSPRPTTFGPFTIAVLSSLPPRTR